MKKTMIVLSALIALVACNKVETEQPTAKEYTYDITITRADDTKAVKANWESGDVVYVFFSNVAAPKYLKFTYDGSAWTRTQYNGATAESFTYPGNGTMTAIYLPYGNDAVVSADGTSFKFDKSYTSYYLKAEKAAYTVSGTTVSGTLNMVAPEGFVQFAMPLSGTINAQATTFFRSSCTYTLSDSNLKPVSFASVAADGSIAVTEGAEGDAITGYIYGGDINFSGVLKSTSDGIAADYEFTFVNNNGTAETYDDVTYRLSGNKTLSYKAAIKFPAISSSAWKVPAPSFVVINGVKWATCNIGATAPEGYGDYFAWGATYPQAKYESADYRESTLSANLAPEKDVAYQKLGSDWHMPTEDEFGKLLDTDNVTWSSWTTENGVYGYWVRDKTNTTEAIFLPAAGYWSVVLYRAGIHGNYWSSKFKDSGYAYGLDFGDGGKAWGSDSRYFGQSVRPVKAAPAPAATGHALSTSVVGEIVGSDGNAYAAVDKGNLPTGVTAVAMIAYVSGSNGLAIALADESGSMNWATAKSTCEAKTPAFTGGTWKLPSLDEWKNMLTYDGDSYWNNNLQTALSTAGGNSLQEWMYYWSSTDYVSDNTQACDVEFMSGYANFSNESKTYTTGMLVRAVLAF